MAKQLLLVLGGTRSGKSSFGLHLAKQGAGRVLYVATADTDDGDPEMERRIADHRRSRPRAWDTVEVTTDLVSTLAPMVGRYETVLLDGLTLWVSRLLLPLEGSPNAERDILVAVHGLLGLYESGDATWIVVSDEVGLGVVPITPLGRMFRDVLGRVHQVMAARADELYYTVAGYALPMKALGAQRIPAPTYDESTPCNAEAP